MVSYVNDTLILDHSDTEKITTNNRIPCKIEETSGARWERYVVTTVWLLPSAKPKKPISPVLSRDSGMFGESWLCCRKSAQCLKTQHFISSHLKMPTVDIAPVKLYPYVKSKTQTQMHEFASCFCLYRLYPHDTLCTYRAKQLKLLGFSQRHLFGAAWCVFTTL